MVSSKFLKKITRKRLLILADYPEIKFTEEPQEVKIVNILYSLLKGDEFFFLVYLRSECWSFK